MAILLFLLNQPRKWFLFARQIRLKENFKSILN